MCCSYQLGMSRPMYSRLLCLAGRFHRENLLERRLVHLRLEDVLCISVVGRN